MFGKDTGGDEFWQLHWFDLGSRQATLLTDGGLFVPTTREYRLGEDIYLLLSLPDDPQRYPVAGKVAWITPAGANNSKAQGIGVHFPADEAGQRAKLRIEEILGAMRGNAEMGICPWRGNSSARRSGHESFLDEIGLVDLLQCSGILRNSDGKRGKAGRTTAELFHQGKKDAGVHIVETC